QTRGKKVVSSRREIFGVKMASTVAIDCPARSCSVSLLTKSVTESTRSRPIREIGGATMLRFAAIGIFLLGGSICLSQTPAVTPSWQELATTSSLVVIGIIDESSLVIRADREVSKPKPQPNGQVIVELQNPADYVLGSLVRLRVKEVIKQNGTV